MALTGRKVTVRIPMLLLLAVLAYFGWKKFA